MAEPAAASAPVAPPRSYLIKQGTQEVHIYSTHLSKRPDMIRVEGTLDDARARAKQLYDDYIAAKEDPIILHEPNNPPNVAPVGGIDMSAPEVPVINLDDVAAAIELLEPGNGKHFTANGLPRIEAIQEQLGGVVIDANQRDQAWSQLSRQRAGQ